MYIYIYHVLDNNFLKLKTHSFTHNSQLATCNYQQKLTMEIILFPSLSSENTSNESGSTSDCSSSTDGVADLEVDLMLASENPKKRAGRKKVNETRHPVYRGVRQRSSGKWVCEVREPNKKSRLWLGTYPTAEMAARAHDVAVLAMRGRSACLNFADSVWRLPVPESSNVKDIKKTAAEAAEAFRQISEDSVETVETNDMPESVFYVDDEEMFGLPGLLDSLAEGLMVPPPQMLEHSNFDDNVDFWADVSLWTF